MLSPGKPEVSDMNTMPRRTRWSGRSPVMSSPPNATRPAQTSIRLMIAFSNVVLPAPLAPRSTTDSCA